MLGFFVAVASHYLADAIPHWDYRPDAIVDIDEKKSRWSARDARVFRARAAHGIPAVALDACLGALLVILLVRPDSRAAWLWVAGSIAGGILPDFLQGLYLSGLRVLKPLQQWHDRMHTNIRLGPYPQIGIPFQLLIAGIAIFSLL